MGNKFNYDSLFDQALQCIKSIRNPHSQHPEEVDLNWNIVSQQLIFNFGGKDFRKFRDVTDASRKISFSCLNAIIMSLFKHYQRQAEAVSVKLKKDSRSEVIFAIKDVQSKTLLIFKEIEDGSFWKLKDSEPEDVQALLKEEGVINCKYIYFLFDYAYLQVIGHNDNENDPGRGYNLYSLKWFFQTYFGEDEYEQFKHSLNKYICNVNDYIGYIYLKSLTPYALINFRKITENRIINFSYDSLLKIKANKYELEKNAFESIRNQFLDERKYMVLLGNHDFSESLITAEWLYDSMRKSQAIDLTVIGMGYFKAVEQLLFDLICLHKNENRLIRKDYSFKALPDQIQLSDDSIRGEVIDTSIGSMANFYKDNLDMLRCDLRFSIRKYVRETIFDYKNLRNGYFHKHNIHRWDKIDEIRNKSFYLIFLLLGSQNLDENDLIQLGLPNMKIHDDYYRLCEYVNYHRGELFFLSHEDGREIMFSACSDMHTKIANGNYIEYSGVYLKELSKEGRVFRLSENQLPSAIYLGKLEIEHSEEIKWNPVKTKKIFEDGKFIGPSIAEEDGINY